MRAINNYQAMTRREYYVVKGPANNRRYKQDVRDGKYRFTSLDFTLVSEVAIYGILLVATMAGRII